MLSDRRRLVLKALVEEYIHTGEPVGSRSLVERHRLRCSSATVRNELGALEESGHVYQPHISSGRIPTDAGYRAFVDGLMGPGGLPRAVDAGAHRSHLALVSEVDDLMRQTSQVLSSLTHYVAVTLAPTISLARIRRIDLLSMGLRRALVVLITESGKVLNRHVELSEDVTPERLAEVERALNASLDGKRAAELLPLRAVLQPARSPQDGLISVVLDQIIGCLEEADRDRVYHVGVPELLALPEFAESARLRPLIGLLEDGIAMLETLSEVMQANEITVRIGSENTRSELGEMSLIVTNYGTGDSDGIVGVIGPTRMDYQRAIGVVRTVADDLSDLLS